MPQHEVIIARYKEDLQWIDAIPEEFEVIVYNKGPAIPAGSLARADRVVSLRNVGRESDTFLTHILEKSEFADGFTVFLQGDPFEHSPDVLTLLRHWQAWKDLQPLSWRWLVTEERPPRSLLEMECDEHILSARVRSESYSLTTWLPLQFFDAGSRWLDDTYRDVHRLPVGVSIAYDFLRRCLWDDLAVHAHGATVGRFSYGGLFAVRQSVLRDLPRRSLELARVASHEHAVYGYVIERLWLHFMGEPFIMGPQHGSAVALNTQPFAGFAPAQVNGGSTFFRRLAPGLKRRVLQWAMT